MKLDACVNVRLPSGVYAAIEAQARQNNVTLSHVIREAMQTVLAEGPANKSHPARRN